MTYAQFCTNVKSVIRRHGAKRIPHSITFRTKEGTLKTLFMPISIKDFWMYMRELPFVLAREGCPEYIFTSVGKWSNEKLNIKGRMAVQIQKVTHEMVQTQVFEMDSDKHIAKTHSFACGLSGTNGPIEGIMKNALKAQSLFTPQELTARIEKVSTQYPIV